MPRSGFLPFLTVLLVLGGCSSSKESSTSDAETAAGTMRRYEAEFDPTLYNPEVTPYLAEELPPRAEPVQTTAGVALPAPAELVPGFRVQIYASTNIDQAADQKQIAEELFPEEWFYLVYDPPTYKIRAGNFLNRFEADRFLKELRAEGFRDSWTVPDKIQKNIAPRSARPPREDPEESIDSGNDQ